MTKTYLRITSAFYLIGSPKFSQVGQQYQTLDL